MQQSTPGGGAASRPAGTTATAKQGFLSSLLQRSSERGGLLGLGNRGHAKLNGSPPATQPSLAPDSGCCAAEDPEQPVLSRSFKSAMFYEYLDAAEEDDTRYHGNYHYSPDQPSWGSLDTNIPRPPPQQAKQAAKGPRMVMLEGGEALPPPEPPVGLWLESMETSQSSTMTYSRSSSGLRSRRESSSGGSLRALEESLPPPPASTPQGYTHRGNGRPQRLEMGPEDDEGPHHVSGLLAALPSWTHGPARAMARSVHVTLLAVQSPSFLLLFSLASLLLVVACLLSVVLINPHVAIGPHHRHHHRHPATTSDPATTDPSDGGAPSRPSSFVPLPVHSPSEAGQPPHSPSGLPPAMMPALGAAATGQYPNLFATVLAKSSNDVQSKVQGLWSRLFVGGAPGGVTKQRLYYEASLPASAASLPMAYIREPGAALITSKGMALGLMACVQLGKRQEFDKLWAFTRAVMRLQRDDDAQYRGLHASSASPDAVVVDPTPDPGAEVVLTTALVFAHRRWGPSFPSYGEGARAIMDALQDPAHGVFTAEGVLRLAPQWGETRPSLQMPAYYEAWARFLQESGADPQQAQVWSRAADQCRQVLRTAANARTGLFPETTDFAGYATASSFGSGAAIASIAVDWLWWRRDAWAVHEADTLLAFLHQQGVPGYSSSFNLDGSPRSPLEPASPGLAATDAIAALVGSDDQVRRALVSELWRIASASPPPANTKASSSTSSGGSGAVKLSGLDGLHVLLAMLHVSGAFHAY